MSKKLLVIGYVWPEPTTTAAGCRMQQLLETFLTFGYRITFASTAGKTEYSLNLEQMGIREATIKLNHSSFDDLVKDLSPHVVLFDRFMVEEQFGWRVSESVPQAIRILNTEDLHALRKAREEAHKKGESFNIDDWKNHPMTLREVSSIYRCDFSLMISHYEKEILQQEIGVPNDLLYHLPLMVEKVENPWHSFLDRKGFVSIGNGKHAPNIDSVKVLKHEIWTRIRKQIPDAELQIYGAYLPQQIKDMHDPKAGFYVRGWAEDVDSVIKNTKVLLAPLQFGAGIKGKLLDAMRTGTPSVTTPIGAEGMHGNLSWNGFVTDDWNEFARLAAELHRNQELWENAQQQCVELLRTFYNRTLLQKPLKERVYQIDKILEAHRQQNFIGKLLQHQTMASTKYMSKWIEEKNRG